MLVLTEPYTEKFGVFLILTHVIKYNNLEELNTKNHTNSQFMKPFLFLFYLIYCCLAPTDETKDVKNCVMLKTPQRRNPFSDRSQRRCVSGQISRVLELGLYLWVPSMARVKGCCVVLLHTLVHTQMSHVGVTNLPSKQRHTQIHSALSLFFH